MPSQRPEIKPGDWIEIGKTGIAARPTTDAVVSIAKPELIEVVYLQRPNQAVNQDVMWVDDHWEFASTGDYGGYAERYDRLSGYVAQLYQGRHRR